MSDLCKSKTVSLVTFRFILIRDLLILGSSKVVFAQLRADAALGKYVFAQFRFNAVTQLQIVPLKSPYFWS